jgi:hypothetical protein
MKKSLLIFLLAVCVLSCAKAQSLGAGVSVDAQGNLKIDAPLYVIDKNPQKPGLKRAPASMNSQVSAGFAIGDSFCPLEVTGGIVNGRLSLTIKMPDEYWLNKVMYFWDVPDDYFTRGADVEIGELSLAADEPEYYRLIMLYPNPLVRLSPYHEIDEYYIEGDRYKYIYSLGDVSISGKFNLPRWYNRTEHYEFDIRIKKGWNVIREGSFFDKTLQDDVTTTTSGLPPASAVWVVLE